MTVITLPTVSEFLSGVETWASTTFTEFLPVVYVVVGLFAAAVILIWFGSTIQSAIWSLFHRDDIY